ncbi:hypothetical protein COV17_00695 [Candidatus Woesearchaeota archaeon CG10_big_fil_rev_8_21_14_0_10_36_11]|nr:MAG: hypothetical protein COV17_00695 [Candidatus Woesearchaeota archaeon CG10_big_fil_rev_8_21_14_0_10_36_11]
MVAQVREARRHVYFMYRLGLPNVDLSDKKVLERAVIVWGTHKNLPDKIRDILTQNGDEINDLCKYARDGVRCEGIYNCVLDDTQWDHVLGHDTGLEYGDGNEAVHDVYIPGMHDFLIGKTNEFEFDGEIYTVPK